METAFLVLDIQKDFTDHNGRLPVAKHQVKPMIDNINYIIKKGSLEGWHIIYIGNEFERNQFISNWLRKNAAIKGSIGSQLNEKLILVNNNYFSKKQGDALSNQNLIDYLKENSIQNLIISGLFAEGCVSATVKGAIKRNFNVTIIEDAVAGANDKNRDKALTKLQLTGASVLHSTVLFK